MTSKSVLDELNEVLADDGWKVEPQLNESSEVENFVLKDSTGKVLYEMPHNVPEVLFLEIGAFVAGVIAGETLAIENRGMLDVLRKWHQPGERHN